jgi:hypothetical protein
LLDAEVSVDGSIASRSSEVLTLPVRDVLAIALDVAFGETKIKEEHLVRRLVQANAEIVRLDVPVDEVAVVDVLNSGDHLVDEHQHRLEGKLAQRVLEERLQRRTHEVHHQHVVVT